MTLSLTTLPKDLQQEICSYLPLRGLVRFANTCKNLQGVVANDEKHWKSRGVGLRVIFVEGQGADRALKQIQTQLQLSERSRRAYRVGVEGGSALYLQTARICHFISVLGVVSAMPLHRIVVAFANFGNRWWHYPHLETECSFWPERCESPEPFAESCKLPWFEEAEYIQQGYFPVGLSAYMVGYSVFCFPYTGIDNRDRAHPHFEDRAFNRYCAAVGALSLGWGIVCFSYNLPLQGTSLSTSGGMLLFRGLNSYRFVTRVFGEARGQWNVVCIRVSSYANRLRNSSPCETISGKLSTFKHSIALQVGKAVRLVEAVAGLVLRALPRPDCG